jgi:hypothetical protein
VWPDPPALPPPVDNGGTSQAPPPSTDAATPATTATPAPQPAAAAVPAGDTAQPTNASAPPAAKPDKGDGLALKTGGDPDKLAVPAGKMVTAAALAGAIGLLLFAGMVLRWIVVKSLRRPRAVKVARREPVLTEAAAVQKPTPAHLRRSPSLVPGYTEADRRVSEVEEALRKLSQRLRARRAPSLKPVARGGAWVRS